MASSSTNSTKKGKVVGFTLDNIYEKRGGGWHRFFFLGGGAPGKGGNPYFLGGGGLKPKVKLSGQSYLTISTKFS